MQERKKKILFLCHTMRGGGVENVLLNVTNRLLKLNYEITLLLIRKEGNFLQFIPKEVSVKYLVKGNEFYPESFFLKILYKLGRRIKLKLFFTYPSFIRTLLLKEKFDTEVVFLGDLMLLWQKILRKDTTNIGWVHSMLIGDRGEGDASVVKASYNFDKVVCVSNIVRNNVIKYFPKFELNSQVIYNPINKQEIILKATEKIEWNYKYPTFVSIGRLTRLKGYFQMMQIHKRLLKEGFFHEIIIVGMGEDYEEMLLELKKEGIEETYYVVGHRQNPYPYVKNADFFFLFSETEGYPLAVQEAVLLGKPMIVTHVGGIPEIVENEKTALIIERDNEQMYEAMKRFLTDSELVEKLEYNCREVSKNYNEEVIYEQIIKLF